MQTGFGQFINCLDEYLELLDDPMITDECQIRIYGSVTLENGTIMRATNSYHDRAWFSDVAILMDSEESNEYISDQGICYGQVTNFCVLIILTIIYFNSNKYSLLGFIISKSTNRTFAKSCIDSVV